MCACMCAIDFLHLSAVFSCWACVVSSSFIRAATSQGERSDKGARAVRLRSSREERPKRALHDRLREVGHDPERQVEREEWQHEL